MDRLGRTPTVVLMLLGTAACTGESARDSVVRTDSAGVEIVISGPTDRPLDWSYIERFSLGGANTGPESFYDLRPEFLGSDDFGRIYILDPTTHQVVTFGADGRFIRAMGRQGEGPGELQRPHSISVSSSGDVSVFDRAKWALVRWDSTGKLLPRVPFPHWPVDGRHFALTGNGYVVSGILGRGDWGMRLIAVTGEDTTLLGRTPSFQRQEGKTRSCGGIIVFPPLFTSAVAWDHRNATTAVAQRNEYRIDFWIGGRLVRSIRRSMPATEATRDLAIREAGDGYTLPNACVVPPDDYADAKGWADTVPAIRALHLSADGALYVQRWVPGPDNDLIDVFAADGHYLGTLPEGTSYPALSMPGGRIGSIRTDAYDVDRLVVSASHSTAVSPR